jgi:hypothetical protein
VTLRRVGPLLATAVEPELVRPGAFGGWIDD